MIDEVVKRRGWIGLELVQPDRIEAALPDYEVGELLGNGGFGTVYAVVHRELEPALAGAVDDATTE